QAGGRTELLQVYPKLTEEVVQLLELVAPDLLHEVAGEQDEIPGAGLAVQLLQVAEELLPDVWPQPLLAGHPEVQVRQVQPAERRLSRLLTSPSRTWPMSGRGRHGTPPRLGILRSWRQQSQEVRIAQFCRQIKPGNLKEPLHGRDHLGRDGRVVLKC